MSRPSGRRGGHEQHIQPCTDCGAICQSIYEQVTGCCWRCREKRLADLTAAILVAEEKRTEVEA